MVAQGPVAALAVPGTFLLSRVKATPPPIRTFNEIPRSTPMDLEHAVQKHSEWKVKFRAAIAAHEQLDVGTIAKDNCCELGQWLYGEARTKWGSLPAYRACVAKHSEFHTAAARIAHAINGKKYAEAEAMLGSATPYAEISRDTVTAIMRLKKEAAL
jgi:methyl-accepting chemotaxis protein